MNAFHWFTYLKRSIKCILPSYTFIFCLCQLDKQSRVDCTYWMTSMVWNFWPGHKQKKYICQNGISCSNSSINMRKHDWDNAKEISFFQWSNGQVVKARDFQSKDSVFKTTGWLQSRLTLSSFRDRSNKYQEFLGT